MGPPSCLFEAGDAVAHFLAATGRPTPDEPEKRGQATLEVGDRSVVVDVLARLDPEANGVVEVRLPPPVGRPATADEGSG